MEPNRAGPKPDRWRRAVRGRAETGEDQAKLGELNGSSRKSSSGRVEPIGIGRAWLSQEEQGQALPGPWTWAVLS